MRGGGRPALSLPQQWLFLNRNPICAGHGVLDHRHLTWTYSVRPTPLSREYTIQIGCEKSGTPKVFVKDPDLALLAGGRDLPHVYKEPTRLCLYLPGSGEWLSYMRIDQTFVPWTAIWLFYFEEWLESNEWKGGGAHPGDATENSVIPHR